MKRNECSLFIVVFLFGILLSSCANSGDLDKRIGICTTIENPLKMKNAGCSFVEVNIRKFFDPAKTDSEFQSDLKFAQNSDIPIYAGNSFFGSDIKLLGPGLDFDKISRHVEITMKRAKLLRTKIFVLGSGGSRRIPEGYDKNLAKKQFLKVCSLIANIAKQYDIIVVIEPLRKQETNFINTVREGLEVVKQVNHPNLKLLADFYHMLSENEGPDAIIEAKEYLYHCHIAEKEGRRAPGTNGEDFVPYFKALKQIGYKGSISLECKWENLNDEINDAVLETKRQINLAYGDY